MTFARGANLGRGIVFAGLLLPGAVPAAAQDIVLQPSAAPTRSGKWAMYSDSTAEGGSVIRHPDAGVAKLSSPLASPTNYFELTFQADAGNEAGNTRNSRIDYIWYLHGASRLVLKQCRVFDVRDANGVQPSDHRPVMSTFDVK